MKEHPMLCIIKEQRDILYIAASDGEKNIQCFEF